MPWVSDSGISVRQGHFKEPSDEELEHYGYVETRTGEHLQADRDEVCRLKTLGMTNAQIGRMLLLPETTVDMLSRPRR